VLDIGLRRNGHGLNLAKLRAHPHGLDLGPLQPSLFKKLRQRGRRIDLLPVGIRQELPHVASVFPVTSPSTDTSTDTATLKLIGRRDVRSNNSWMHNSARLVSGKPRCTLWIHPQDAAARQLQDGQQVNVASRVGQVSVPVHLTEDIRPGVVSLPHGWGHDRPGTNMQVAQAHAGASINDLTDDRLTERISANAAFSAVPVRVEAA
jgi:anaerobic selenocysteine-containing dehydrogenase